MKSLIKIVKEQFILATISVEILRHLLIQEFNDKHNLINILFPDLLLEKEKELAVCKQYINSLKNDNSDLRKNCDMLISNSKIQDDSIQHKDQVIAKLYENIHRLSDSIEEFNKKEHTIEWALLQVEAGHSVTHPMLDDGKIYVYGTDPHGVKIYRIEKGYSYDLDIGGKHGLQRFIKLAQFTIGWSIESKKS